MQDAHTAVTGGEENCCGCCASLIRGLSWWLEGLRSTKISSLLTATSSILFRPSVYMNMICFVSSGETTSSSVDVWLTRSLPQYTCNSPNWAVGKSAAIVLVSVSLRLQSVVVWEVWFLGGLVEDLVNIRVVWTTPSMSAFQSLRADRAA